MAGKARDGGAKFLRRWSQRKLAAARQATPAPPRCVRPGNGATAGRGARPRSGESRRGDRDSACAGPGGHRRTAPDEAPPLPPVDSLGFDSDFTRFLAPKVDEAVKRQALRKLFNDPRFNVMDGLDVYIDDYSKFEPIRRRRLSPSWSTRATSSIRPGRG